MTWILLRHGGMGRVFTGIRAPSTLGTFLRTFTFGHVRQLDAVAADFLVNLIGAAPALRDAAVVTYLDIDDTVKATHGYTKQGAGYGYSGIKGLNALIATVSTPISAPLIAATRLRKGSANSARGAARLIGDALATTKRCGATGLVILRADSAYYNHDVVAAATQINGGLVFVPIGPIPNLLRSLRRGCSSVWLGAALFLEDAGDVGGDRGLRHVELTGDRGEKCPSSWGAASESRSEIRVATVLRNVWGVTQSSPVSFGYGASDTRRC